MRNGDERQSIKYTNLLTVRYLKYKIFRDFLFSTLQCPQSSCYSSPHCMCRFHIFRNPPKDACPDRQTPLFLQQCFRHHPRASLLDSAVCPSGEELGALLVAHLSCFFGAQFLCSSHELLVKCFCSASLSSQLGCLALWSNKEKLFLLEDRELQRPGMGFLGNWVLFWSSPGRAGWGSFTTTA